MLQLNNTPTSRQLLSKTDGQHVAAAVGLALSALLAIACNSFLIAVFMYNKRLRTRPTNYLLVNLAVANILVCVNAVPMRILHLLGSTVVPCKVTGCFTIAVCSGAVLTLAASSIDRYIGVTWPLTYSCTVTPSRVVLSICFIWFISIVVGFLPFVGWGELPVGDSANLCTFAQIFTPEFILFVLMTTVILPLVVIVFAYGQIYMEVRRHVKQIRTVCVPRQPAENGSSTAHGEETKAAKTIACIVGAYMICQAPILLVELIAISGGNVAPSLATFAIVLAYSNALLSPLVCARVHSEFKQTLYRLIVVKICQENLDDYPDY